MRVNMLFCHPFRGLDGAEEEVAVIDAVRLHARAGLRRRRWSWVLVGVLVAATGAGSIGCLAAARRTASAHERYLRASRASDIELASSPVCGGHPCTPAQFMAIPGVAGVSSYARLLTLMEDGQGKPVPSEPPPVVGAISKSPWSMSRPVARHGRLPAAEATDEVFATEAFATEHHLSIGERFTMRTFTQEEGGRLPAELKGGPKVGRSIPMRLVGTGASGAGIEQGSVLVVPPRMTERLEQIGQIFDLTVDGGSGATDRVLAQLDARYHLEPDDTRTAEHTKAQRAVRPYVAALTAY